MIFDVSAWWLIAAVLLILLLVWRISYLLKLLNVARQQLLEHNDPRAWKTDDPGFQDAMTAPYVVKEKVIDQLLRKVLPSYYKSRDTVLLFYGPWMTAHNRNGLPLPDTHKQTFWLFNHIVTWHEKHAYNRGYHKGKADAILNG